MPYDYSRDWGKSEPRRILELVREVGVHRLANFDGCLCGEFEVRNVRVEFACGKGSVERGIRISSRSMDYPSSDIERLLDAVGVELQRQIESLNDGRGPMPVHFLKEVE